MPAWDVHCNKYHPSICTSTHSSNHPFIYFCIHPIISPSFINPSTHPFVYQPIHQTIPSSIHSHLLLNSSLTQGHRVCCQGEDRVLQWTRCHFIVIKRQTVTHTQTSTDTLNLLINSTEAHGEHAKTIRNVFLYYQYIEL